MLAEEQALDLDQPIRRIVPELRVPDPVLAERITLRDVLAHRSGLGRHDLSWILRPDLTEDGLLAALAVLPPAGDLRAGFEYSNFGYALVGIALARVTGEPWAELLRRRVLEPAGLKQTVVGAFPGPDAAADRATPHLLRDDRPTPTEWRSIGIVSNSPGPLGGVSAAKHLQNILPGISGPILGQPEIYLNGVGDAFDDKGECTKEALQKVLQQYIDAFAAFIEKQNR